MFVLVVNSAQVRKGELAVTKAKEKEEKKMKKTEVIKPRRDKSGAVKKSTESGCRERRVYEERLKR